jgi:hypothetical protein
LLPLSIATLLAACSANNSNQWQPDGSSNHNDAARNGGDGSSSNGDGSSSGDVAPIPTPDAGDGCSDAARLVYVLSDANELYSFRPDMRMFTRIGTLTCNTTMQPNSMAIDRNAVAWVNYVDSSGGFGDSAGAIYRVSTTDAHCTSDAPINLTSGWFRLGMGFSSDATSGSAETLFVAATADPLGGGSDGLGRIDPASLNVVPIGSFSGSLMGQSAELTGTGDGRLYGFFTTTPVQIAQIDKTSGATSMARSLSQVETPAAWAFSFWGGDFYLYTAPDPTLNPGRTTNVTRYRPSDGSVDASYMTNIGFTIVGAGVSTCAPILPPG